MNTAIGATAGTFCAMLFALSAAPNPSSDPPAADTQDKNDEVEAVGDVEVQAASGPHSLPKALSPNQILGRLHPSLVHLPLGLVIAIVLLELLSLLYPRITLGQSSLVLSIAAIASFIPTMVSGWLRANEIFGQGSLPELLSEHRLFVFIAAGIFVVSFVWRIVRKDNLQGVPRFVYLGLLLISAGFFVAGGHHGGLLVYGEDFLPF